MKKSRISVCILAVVLLFFLVGNTFGANYVTFSSLSAFQDALGGVTPAIQNFDSYTSNTNLNGIDFLPGVNVTSNMQYIVAYSDETGEDLFAYTDGSSYPPNHRWDPSTRTYYDINFTSSYNSVGFNIDAWNPLANGPGLMEIFFSDGTSASIPLSKTSGSETDPVFFGIIANTPINRIRWNEPPEVLGSLAAWEETALDDISAAVASPPSVPGLVAYYPFNGNANDESGNGHNGTVYGPTLTLDRFGIADSAYHFDGIDDYISAGPDPISNNGSVTFMAWFYPEDVTPYTFHYILTTGGHTASPGYCIYLWSDRIVINRQTDSSRFLMDTYDIPYTVQSGKWYQAAGVHDSATNKLSVFINGDHIITFDPSPSTPNLSYRDIWIGRVSQSNHFNFKGIIDDIRIYNRALTGDEILQLYGGLAISSINPDHGKMGESPTFTLDGTGFQAGATVELTNFVLINPPDQTSIVATSLIISPPTQITGTFDLTTGAVIGQYDVVVTNPDGQLAILSKGFTVLDTSPPVTTAFPAGGTYNAALKVALKANEPATISYSTNGVDFFPYTDPIDISITTTLTFYATDAAGNTEGYKTEVYTIDTGFIATTVLDTPTDNMIMPVTSTFTFHLETLTFVVDRKVSYTLRDWSGYPLPQADNLRVLVIPDDLRTYSGEVSVTCDLAQLYPPEVLVPGDYTLEVCHSNFFQPPGIQVLQGSICASTTVSVTASITTHIITTSVGSPGGNIYLAGSVVSGPVRVANESTPTFTITPTTSYQVDDVKVDEISAGAVTSYTFDPVYGDHTIAASFKDAFRGFFQPVNNWPTLNRVKAGQAIPVKFSLTGNKGLNIFAAGYPKSISIGCDASATVEDVEQTVTAGNSSLSYDAASDQYTYVWKTEKGWSGTCRQLVVKFNDGVVKLANFKFTK